jgi:putative ABC transport system permease protein
MLSDLRFALRMLTKSPGFSAVAIITLALGIGANTAIFSVIDAVLLRPLPFPEADRLVRIYETFGEEGAVSDKLNLSEQTLRQWRDHGGDIFESIGAATGASLTNGPNAEGTAHNFRAARISSNFLTTVGLQPLLGRNFTAAEDQPGGARVVIIGYDFWRRNLSGRTDVVGQTVRLDGALYTIVGVMPKTFRHPYRAELWLPLALTFSTEGPRYHYLYGVARLRRGISIAQADAAVRRMCAAIDQAARDPNNPKCAAILPLRDSFIMDVRPKLLIIAAAAVCALLVAAANFAGLLLSRAIERDGEMALRSALGATRGRIVRQGLAQAFLLAVFGTLGGLLIASWLTPLLVALSPEGTDITGSAIREFDYAVRLDWPVFAFAAGVMVLIGLGFGLLPAWRASRADLRGAISHLGRGATLDGGTPRVLSGLIVTELTMAAVLLTGSLLLTQHFRSVVNQPWGFSTQGRMVFNAMFSDRLFASPEARLASIERVLAELRLLPGVRSASVTAPPPTEAARDLMSCVPEGSHPAEPRGYYIAYLRTTHPGHFATLGQTLLRGRDFNEADRADTQPVCIVNESFARRFWPGQDPLGKRVKQGRLDDARPSFAVVGVVADTKAITDPRDGEVVGTVCLPLPRALASNFDELTFVVNAETSSRANALEPALPAALSHADNRLVAYDVTSLDAAAADTWVAERFLFVLVSLFGVLGLILAAVGLYGLLTLRVAQREYEFGIRSALGATPSQIIQLVARQGATLLGVGSAVASVITWGSVRIVQSYWPAMPAPNLIACLLAGAVLFAAATFACWFPARRAARVDPVIALRAE